jgi:hypothetical protein
MAKQGIDHHLCRAHGASGIIISEMPPNAQHRFKVECYLCKRWLSWCNEKQAEEFARRFGRGVKWSFYPQGTAGDVQLPALPTIREAERSAGIQQAEHDMQIPKDLREDQAKIKGTEDKPKEGPK